MAALYTPMNINKKGQIYKDRPGYLTLYFRIT